MTSSLDIGEPPHPTDRERAIALALNRTFRATDGSTPALITSISRALAAYRVELEQRGERERAYQLVECELRDRRVIAVSLTADGRVHPRCYGDVVTRPARDSLIAAVDALDGKAVAS